MAAEQDQDLYPTDRKELHSRTRATINAQTQQILKILLFIWIVTGVCLHCTVCCTLLPIPTHHRSPLLIKSILIASMLLFSIQDRNLFGKWRDFWLFVLCWEDTFLDHSRRVVSVRIFFVGAPICCWEDWRRGFSGIICLKNNISSVFIVSIKISSIAIPSLLR